MPVEDWINYFALKFVFLIYSCNCSVEILQWPFPHLPEENKTQSRPVQMLLTFHVRPSTWIPFQMPGQTKARSLELYLGLPAGWWGSKHLSHYQFPPKVLEQFAEREGDQPGFNPRLSAMGCSHLKLWVHPLHHNASPSYNRMHLLKNILVWREQILCIP